MGPPRILGQGLTWNDLYGLYIDLIGVPSTISEFLFLLCRFDRFSSFIVVATGHYSHHTRLPLSLTCRCRFCLSCNLLHHYHLHPPPLSSSSFLLFQLFVGGYVLKLLCFHGLNVELDLSRCS